MARTTYTRASRFGDAFSQAGDTWSTPRISTTGGITIGRIVIVSMIRRTFGSRRCTQMTVGTISTRVSTVVITASWSDSLNASLKPSWLTTAGNEDRPANRKPEYNGSAK